MIRLFKFKNNFLSEKAQPLQADYCVIGYFDGLDMIVYDENDQAARQILSDPLYKRSWNPDEFEACDYFGIAGIRDEDDKEFWQQGGNPFVFISFVRLKRRSSCLQKIMSTIENRYHALCYTTLDSSDMIVCVRTKSYHKGYEAIEGYRRVIETEDSGNRLQKGFSLLAIWQEVLNALVSDGDPMKADSPAFQEMRHMDTEEISCMLRGVVKGWEHLARYIMELENISSQECEVHGILGSEDIILYLRKIDSRNLFKMYAEKGILTHVNEYYQKGFYNIKTELSVKKSKDDKAWVR